MRPPYLNCRGFKDELVLQQPRIRGAGRAVKCGSMAWCAAESEGKKGLRPSLPRTRLSKFSLALTQILLQPSSIKHCPCPCCNSLFLAHSFLGSPQSITIARFLSILSLVRGYSNISGRAHIPVTRVYLCRSVPAENPEDKALEADCKGTGRNYIAKWLDFSQLRSPQRQRSFLSLQHNNKVALMELVAERSAGTETTAQRTCHVVHVRQVIK